MNEFIAIMAGVAIIFGGFAVLAWFSDYAPELYTGWMARVRRNRKIRLARAAAAKMNGQVL